MTTFDDLKKHLEDSALSRILEYGGDSESTATLKFLCGEIDKLKEQSSNKSGDNNAS